MARLPTSADLSQPASFRSGRMISSADTSAIGRGLQAFGDGVSALGAKFKQEREKQKQQQNVVDVARAETVKTQRFLDLQNQFDQDGDYATFGARAGEGTQKAINEAANLIRDPEMRERYLAQAQTDAVRANDTIIDKGRALRQQAETNALDEALEANRRLYVDPLIPEDVKAKARNEIIGAIDVAGQAGLLTPDQVDARKKKFVDGADVSRAELAVQQDPSVITKPLPPDVAGRSSAAVSFFVGRGYTKEQAAGIVGNLIAESRLQPSGAVGDNGTAFGIAQWRGERLTRLKRYAASKGADWQDFTTQLEFVDVELQNHETSAYKALKAAKTVDEATAAFISYERPAGWTPANPRGGHNYSGRLKNAAAAAGIEVNPDWFKRLSPEDQFRVQKQAETRQNQINAETRAGLEVAADNAPTAIFNTGKYDAPLPTLDQFQTAYGAVEGAERYGKFQAAVETSQQAYGMRTMSASEIEEVVQGATPRSSGNDAALEQARYDALSKAAASTLKAREADPAAYVRQHFPSVGQAWSTPDQAGGFQAAIAASVAAQRQIGITDIKPMPKEFTESTIASFKDETLPEADRINSVAGVLMATSDPEQQRAIFEQMVEAGLPDMTEGAFAALSRGDSGAANRLFRAALVDPSKLPGKAPATPAQIDEQVQTTLMDAGQVGDLYYGLSDGTAENLVRAQRDSKLLNNAVNIRLRNGETIDAAVAGAAKDLYGDVKPVTSGRAQILIPSAEEERPYIEGMNNLMPQVESALMETMAVPADAPTADSTRAIMDATSRNYISNVMSEGYFRNAGDGYVFMDPFTGGPVFGRDGQPLTFTREQVLAAVPAPRERMRPDPSPLTDDAFTDFQKRMQQ